MTEETVDKVLDTIEREGAERLSEILRDPAVQDAMARGVNEAIVDFLRRPVASVLGEPDDPSVAEAREHAGRVGHGHGAGPRAPASSWSRSCTPAWRRRAPGRGARCWSACLRSAWRRGWSRRRAARRRRRSTGRRSGAWPRRSWTGPSARPARWLPEGAPDRIEGALGDPLWEWLQTQVPDVVQRIDVARRVEEKVLEFPTPKMEELVRKVTDRELRLIVRLGYVLGAAIGVLLVGVNALFR